MQRRTITFLGGTAVFMAGCRVCPGSDAGRWLYEYYVAREHPTLGGCTRFIKASRTLASSKGKT